MRKQFYTTLFFILFSLSSSFAQVGERITSLPPAELSKFAGPLSTFFGTYFNSGGYYSAAVPKTFGFKLSIIGMYVFIPDDQTTFTPDVPNASINGEKTATFFGSSGGVYLGSKGFVVYPFGLNVQKIPAAIYQVSGSLSGVELMLRYLPEITLKDVKTGLWGVGLKYSISNLIPLSPVDIAVQVLYNNFSFEFKGENIDNSFKSESQNFAANVHVSKTFGGLFTVYGGLQFESTTLDLDYNFRDPNKIYPDIADQNVNVSIDGDNNFRATLGAAVKLAVIVLNIDYNIASQNIITAGINLEI